MKVYFSVCLMAAMLCIGCSKPAHHSRARSADDVTVSAALGSHTLLTHDQGKGTAPAITPGMRTQKVGSVLLALVMGRNANYAVPADNYNNKWKPVSRRNMYANGPFYTAVWGVAAASGGLNHTLSVDKPSDPLDEISLAFIEIANARTISDYKYKYAKGTDDISPGSVTTDGPATLIAVWGGDSSLLTHTATPTDGFNVIDSYLNLGPTSGVQIAIAYKTVTQAGTYSVSWKSTPAQGAACYLIVVQ